MSCVVNLNKNLKAALALHINAKSSHWNVRGANFMATHELFDDLQAEALKWADTMAEQLGYMGKEAEATAKLVGTSYIGLHKVGVADAEQHIKALLSQLEKFEKENRKAIDDAMKDNDQPVADIFIEVTRSACKYIYFLKSHLND